MGNIYYNGTEVPGNTYFNGNNICTTGSTHFNGNNVDECLSPAPADLEITWPTQYGDCLVTIEGEPMQFSNDGVTWSTIAVGSNQTMASGAGPYTLKEDPALGGVTVCRFSDFTTGGNFGGSMVATGGTNLTSTGTMFAYKTNVISIDVSGMTTPNVTSMVEMFSNASGPNTINVAGLDTSGVTTMLRMFSGCTNVNSLDVSGFDTTNVTDMQQMFAFCEDIVTLNLANFNTAKVTTMLQMFEATYLMTSLDVSNFNTSLVTDMALMFSVARSLSKLHLTSFDTSNVTDTHSMFANCLDLTCITNIDTTGSFNRNDMFLNDTLLASPNLTEQGNIEAQLDWVGGTCP